MKLQGRSRFKMFAVMCGWLIVYRIVLLIGVAAVAGVSVGLHHTGNPAAARADGRELARSMASTLLALTWIGRIAIVVAARKGLLPGTRIPQTTADVAAIFADSPVERRNVVARPFGRGPAPEPIPTRTLADIEALETLARSHAVGELTAEEFASRRMRLLRAA